MYGKISLKDYAGHANLPLPTVYVRQGSAATIGFLDVPDAATSVSFTAVNVAGVALTVAAAKVDGIWTATLPASHFAVAGNVENGITIKASDGTSEWSLGVGGLVVLSAEATPAPGETATNVTDKTLDGEEMDTGTIGGLREAVRKLGGALGATVTALALCVQAMPLQDIPVTNDVYTAAETDLAISNAIAQIPPPAAAGVSTNDVCGIVTNTMKRFGEWVITPPAWEGERYSLYVFTNAENRLTGWLDIYVESMEQTISYDIDGDCPLDATEMSINFGSYQAKREASEHNALGLAREKDLPQNAPVDEIRFNGADGKVYRLRIGAGGSVDIYTEISQ